ncbi:unnamed protein product [Ranitomeya imitator]|uniref:Uncharacterized protein n=1 Tax=Ranitomeya imitator TaxID=111125 RepID=A0ABN9LH47_9NEOB|nr:unnamed protein product [Ranitomeya imitator]
MSALIACGASATAGKTRRERCPVPSVLQKPVSRGSDTSTAAISQRKSTAGTPVDLLAMANNILSKHAATQLSAFPTLVEERLNKLDVTQRSHAERLMFDVLNAAAAGKLSDTSMLNITDRQPSSQFYLGPPQEPMHSTPVRRPGPHHSQFWTPPAPPSFADFSQGPPTSTHRYSEMDTYYQNL